jgi:uncharacterized cupredoxin-like copper-binding protein
MRAFFRILAAGIVLALGPSAAAADDKTHHKSHASKGHDHAKAAETPFGRAADPKKAKRTVRVEMTDQMRFHPAQITVKQGEMVRFVPVNKGQVMHEMVLGTMDDLKKHAEMMKKHPGMHHDAPNMAHIAPGKEGVLGWQFTRTGEFFYGCLVPGHFDAGMIGKITVTP